MMDCVEVNKEEDPNVKFNSLLQNFSHYVDKEAGEHGFQDSIQFSDSLVLNDSTFSKYVTQPLERYLGISTSNRLEAFFESLRPFDVVVGKVSSVSTDHHLRVTLLYRVDGHRRYISDLHVAGIVDPPLYGGSSTDEDFIKVGDKVKGVITSVNRGEVVHISFQDRYLHEDQIRYFPLGKMHDDDEECEKSDYDVDIAADSMAYVRDLERSKDFVDPHSIKRLLNQMKLPEESVSFVGHNLHVMKFESADVMREKQSSKWSMDMVGTGVKHFREKRLKEAMKCFDQSISFYPRNVEAFVARGALKANKNELTEAVDDFREALQINPKHRNAKKYIIETLCTIAKRYEKGMKWNEALHTYKEILDIDSDQKDALKQYNQIKQILRPKSISSKSSKHVLSPGKSKTLSIKSKERLKKLKKLLQAETVHDPISSSSSSSFEGNSSEDDEMWVEKPILMERRESSGKGVT